MPAPVEILRLQQAVEQFQSRAPRDLPDGVMDKLGEVMQELGSFDNVGNDSPGKRDVASVTSGTEGTGEHYSKAAKGPDGPSPGQREARTLSQEIHEAAASIMERRGGGEDAS